MRRRKLTKQTAHIKGGIARYNRKSRDVPLTRAQRSDSRSWPTLEGRFVEILEGDYKLTPDVRIELANRLRTIVESDFEYDAALGLHLPKRPAPVDRVNFALGRVGEGGQSYNIATHTIHVMLDRDRNPALLEFLKSIEGRFARRRNNGRQIMSEPRERVRAFLALLALVALNVGDQDARSVIEYCLHEFDKTAPAAKLPFVIGGLCDHLASIAGAPKPRVPDDKILSAWNATSHLAPHKRVEGTARLLHGALTNKQVRVRCRSLGVLNKKRT
jgi:hypothetical protein